MGELNPHVTEAVRTWFAGKYGPPERDAWNGERFRVALAAAGHLVDMLGQPGAEDAVIEMSTQIASRTGEPRVVLRWGQMMARLTPDEAREHAVHIIDCAGAAEADVLMFRFLHEKLGLKADVMGAVMADFRAIRESDEPPPTLDDVLQPPSDPKPPRPPGRGGRL